MFLEAPGQVIVLVSFTVMVRLSLSCLSSFIYHHQKYHQTYMNFIIMSNITEWHFKSIFSSYFQLFSH